MENYILWFRAIPKVYSRFYQYLNEKNELLSIMKYVDTIPGEVKEYITSICDEASRFMPVWHEKYSQWLEMDNNRYDFQYSRGGQSLSRGYYCYERIHHEKKGKLISSAELRNCLPDFEYGFQNNNLRRVVRYYDNTINNSSREYIMYEENCSLGITAYRSQSDSIINEITLCEYKDKNILSRSLMLYGFDFRKQSCDALYTEYSEDSSSGIGIEVRGEKKIYRVYSIR